jgi:pantoate--beta-alanine ligase
MKVFKSNVELREHMSAWRSAGDVIGFVPTMGNLHQGHLKLVHTAKQQANRIVASIFVNPLQFSQDTDFKNYPRTVDQDIESLKSLGVDALYRPSEESIYPDGMEKSSKVSVPNLSNIMCGEFRPGHFEGVATVVAMLFNIVQPQVAVFGEKDFQQLVIIRKMVEDLNFPVKIIGVETEREESGLALSSRNQYLSEQEKATASQLYCVLRSVAGLVKQRVTDKSPEPDNFLDIEQDAMKQLAELGFKPEYLQVRDAPELALGNIRSTNLRVFAAAWLGQARLIDNLPIA